MTGVAVTQRLTCSQQHSHYEVEHREPLEAITLLLYTAEVITGQERKSRRISRSRDFNFAEKVRPDKSGLLENSRALARICAPT